MRRILNLMGVTIAVTALAGALAAASVKQAKLGLRHTSKGTILVDSRGYTLYAFTRDNRNHDACAKIRGCLGAWPAVETSSRAVAGRGVHSSLIGTITLPNGHKQVTYAGHPLYLYSGDGGPGQTYYISVFQFNGYWPAVNASGGEVK